MDKKKILVFGSNGMLGNYLSNYFEKEGYEVLRSDRREDGVDITDKDMVKEKIFKSSPNFVINCAAYTDVNKAESEPLIAGKVNGLAPGYMASNCKELNIPFIHISTDYVFGGNKEEGYPEDSKEFKPLNIYGQTKLEGEFGVLGTGGDDYIFRTSWLFGPNSSNFVGKITSLALNPEIERLKVVTDEIGCPTYVGDLTRKIELAVESKIEPGIYHVCSSNAISRYEFAKEILNEQNIEKPIDECLLGDFERPAKVPFHSQLIDTKLGGMRKSEEMISEYFSDIKNERDDFNKEVENAK